MTRFAQESSPFSKGKNFITTIPASKFHVTGGRRPWRSSQSKDWLAAERLDLSDKKLCNIRQGTIAHVLVLVLVHVHVNVHVLGSWA